MPALAVSPTLQDVYLAVQPFVMTVTGLSDQLVIQGLPNRAQMPPPKPGFVVMQATRLKRLRTNVDSWDTTDPAPTTMQAEQGTEVRMQLDCYGPDSADWSVMLSTLLRDEFGCTALAPTCQPLYAEDPVLAPLDDSEQQYEQRWIVGAILQYNPVTTTPMQFADALTVDLINVDKTYPP